MVPIADNQLYHLFVGFSVIDDSPDLIKEYLITHFLPNPPVVETPEPSPAKKRTSNPRSSRTRRSLSDPDRAPSVVDDEEIINFTAVASATAVDETEGVKKA